MVAIETLKCIPEAMPLLNQLIKNNIS